LILHDDDNDGNNDNGTFLCLPLQSACILLLTAALLSNSWEYNYVHQHCVNWD